LNNPTDPTANCQLHALMRRQAAVAKTPAAAAAAASQHGCQLAFYNAK